MINEKLAKIYCKNDISLIENYDQAISDTTQMWHCHHRRETVLSRKELIEIGEYYNRPACELIFLTKSEHNSLHKLGKPTWNKGKHHSVETRKKMSEALKGKNLGKHHSEESKKKMSLRHKGRDTWMKGKHHSAEARKKISEAQTGTHWYNNGVKSIQAKTCPEGFVPGRIVCNKRA